MAVCSSSIMAGGSGDGPCTAGVVGRGCTAAEQPVPEPEAEPMRGLLFGVTLGAASGLGGRGGVAVPLAVAVDGNAVSLAVASAAGRDTWEVGVLAGSSLKIVR
jgi:hypothetical protein